MKYASTVVAALVGAVLLLVSSIGHADDRLLPPNGYFAAVGHHPGSYHCEEPPKPYTGIMDFPSKYKGSGKARDQVNKQADAEYETRIRSTRDLEKGVNKIIGKYMDTGRPEALACAIHWYQAWADADGLLGPATTYSGRAIRKWTLASLSSAWLHLEFSSSQPLKAYPQQSADIEAWLGKVADKVSSEWHLDAPRHKINNHYYWVGWSLMSTGVVLNRRDLFDWGVNIYKIFDSQVDADGYLPNELKRDTRALGYHNFAITPLAMMAAFGKANGIDLAGSGDNALQRLADRTLHGLADPEMFQQKTGYKQKMEGFEHKHLDSKLAWMEPYCWTVGCDHAELKQVKDLSPMVNSRLGGDMTATFGVQ